MRRYSCAWCTAETVEPLPPVGCAVCGEQGEFLFADVSPLSPLSLRALRYAVGRRMRLVLVGRR